MDKKKGSPHRKRNVFKGSVLVSLLVESHPHKFPTRLAASRLARRLYQDGHIRSIFGASQFEDSAQLYVWNDNVDDAARKLQRGDGGHLGGGHIMTSPVSSSISTPALPSSHTEAKAYDQNQIASSVDWQLVQDIKSKVLNRSETYNIVTSYNTFFQELERDFGFDHNKAHTSGSGLSGRSATTPYTSTLELKKQSSAHKSADTLTASRGQAEKEPFLKTAGEAAKRRVKSPPSKENPQSGESVSATYKPLGSSNVGGKQSPSKHNVIVSTRSISKDRKAGQKVESQAKTAHPLNKAQPQSSGSNFSSPSKASSHSPPSAPVKPHQHQKHPNYLYHQYQNQPNLVNSHVISLTAPLQTSSSEKTPKQNVHNQRTPKQSSIMESDSSVNLFNSKAYHKGFNSMSPESHTPLNSQPSTLESGIGSSHPDSTANLSSVPPNHQSFSMVTLEHSDSRPQHYDPYSQTNPHKHQHYNRETHVCSQETQHDLRSISPPPVPKYPDEMSPNGGRDAPRKDPSPGTSQNIPSSLFIDKAQKLKDIGRGSDPLETSEMTSIPNTRFHNAGVISAIVGDTNTTSVTTTNGAAVEGVVGVRDVNRWATESGVVIDGNNSYSDNEKQLLEEMRRMKQEHQSVLRTYEGRVNKLMAKMHELRNIAEMLENSSSKPLPGKLTLLDILEDKDLPESRVPATVGDNGIIPALPFNVTAADSTVDTQQGQTLVPPPLPPRPSRGTRVYPNKPIIHTSAHMRPLLWTRIILDDEGQLEAPEYLVYELSKVDHFRERLEFLRFKNKLQINLFEIDQQLKELNTACEEITSNLSLKNVLETVLAVGNHMNAGTDRGQADGFGMDILNTLKGIQDTLKRGNLLELILRIYCVKYESALDVGCPTRFQLPEPSNMRHAAQVSFEDIQRALKELKEELAYVRGKLEALSVKEGNTVTIALRVTSENFMTSAMEVLTEEEKLLETTRIQFWKTASYFSQEGQRSSPREFFQVWASFLHDCKYYWKLAHRNLARDRFTADLATKSQLSSSSLPGFNSLKSTMMRHVASFSQDEEMRENRARQLEHINSWIESVGRYTLEMGPEDHEEANFFNETDYLQHPQQQQHAYYHHQSHHHQNPYQQSQHEEVVDNAFDLPENADERDCLTPVNLPENDIHDNHYGYYQHRHQVIDSKHQRKCDSDQYGYGSPDDGDISSPYYKNQPRVVHIAKTSSRHQQHHTGLLQPQRNQHSAKDVLSSDQNQIQTSPKPIKAIPPNVIKPQPITQVSPSVSSPSPTSPHPVHMVKPLSSVDTNNNHNSANKQNISKSSSPNTNKLSNNNRVNKHTANTEYSGNPKRDGHIEEDTFGFEPFYESLSRHALNHLVSPASDGSETPPPYTESKHNQILNPTQDLPHDYYSTQNVSSPGSSEQDNTQKKNGSFFKSLLKRDSKQRHPTSSGDQHQNSNNQQSSHQHSALRSVSAPFNKFRNTVVQKLSGNSSSKKSHAENEKSPSSPDNDNCTRKHEGGFKEIQDGMEESPPKPPRGFLVDHHDQDTQQDNKAVNSGTNPFHDDVVNYQNYFYPGQPRRADVAANTDRGKRNQEESGFEGYLSSARPAAVMLVGSAHRDGHDSLPSTVSSHHSGRDQGLSMFRDPNTQGLSQSQPHSNSKSRKRSRSRDHLEEQSQRENSPDHRQRHGHKGGPRSRSGRDRAPIALGSNVSISDMYGKSLEVATQFSDNEATEEMKTSETVRNEFMQDIQPNTQNHYSEHTVTGKGDVDTSKSISMTAEPKWIKAKAVPVYKAKLIPNYENQTKYDPKLEGGIRGHAGPVTSSVSGPHFRHEPQSSSSSDMYRKELQKKSGQYVVGGGGGGVIYQDPSNCSSSKARNGTSPAVICSPTSAAFPGAPTSYTVLPPKFSSNHYHASPLIFSQYPSNSSQLHQSLNPGKKPSEGSNVNVVQRSSSSPPPHQNQNQTSEKDNADTETHHIKTVAASMFTVSPDGRLELGPSRDAHSAEGGLSNKERNQQSNRNVVARRSSSANNILDRAHGVSKSPYDGLSKKCYHADDNVHCSRHHENSKNSHNDKHSQGRMSRRDDSCKKATPTSWRQPAAPQSVMSLIDRFEQTPPPNASPSSNFLHPPLMEDDKPPSMTSTPLARRKNIRDDETMVSPPISSGRSDDASTHSHSTGSKKSSHHYVEHHKPHHRHLVKEFDIKDRARSHGYYHKHDDHGSHGYRKYDNDHKSNNTKRSGSYPETPQHQGIANSLPEPQQHNHHPNKSSPSSSNSSHHHNNRNHRSQQRDRHPNDGMIKSAESQQGKIQDYNHRDRGKEIRASSQGASTNPDQGWGQGRLDERLTYSSQSHRHGPHQSTPPVSSGSSHVPGTAYHSSFLPKPEPQYPGQQKQQQNQNQSNNLNPKSGSNRDHYSSDRNFNQLYHQHGQSSPMGGGKDHEHQISQFPAASNSNINKNVGSEAKSSRSNSHNVHRRPSPQILYISPMSAQQASNSSSSNKSHSNNNNNNDNLSPSTTISNNNNHNDKGVSGMQAVSSGNDLYTAELRRAIKSTNSAFDRPLKSGPLYGRQPGAMAVVKPTVLHP
ncbi:formin-2 [Elysia marginata]|uniref:Formin-2 n=1 Tax=Elysia marginata TaxID=1093978 RepID=A0AAV4IN22_9GAST|nr:formin-2 [Elysia marginata]